MASPSLSLLLLFFSLSLLAGFSAGRPCKTIFISYTFTSSKTLDLQPFSHHNPSYLAIYRYFPLLIIDRPPESEIAVQSEPSFGFTSLQERAKDILVVVAGLLFGVGCGALTGTIMYLAWSLFTTQFDFCRYGDAEEEDEEDQSPKKMGYIKIAETDDKI